MECCMYVVALQGRKRCSSYYVCSLLKYKAQHLSGLEVDCPPYVLEVLSSIPGLVIPKTFKMVLDASMRAALKC